MSENLWDSLVKELGQKEEKNADFLEIPFKYHALKRQKCYQVLYKAYEVIYEKKYNAKYIMESVDENWVEINSKKVAGWKPLESIINEKDYVFYIHESIFKITKETLSKTS